MVLRHAFNIQDTLALGENRSKAKKEKAKIKERSPERSMNTVRKPALWKCED